MIAYIVTNQVLNQGDVHGREIRILGSKTETYAVDILIRTDGKVLFCEPTEVTDVCKSSL
jgi:hypothetical protein